MKLKTSQNKVVSQYCLIRLLINTNHAAGASRRQVQHFTKLSKNVNVLKFHDRIWNHYEKYIQMSPNMPGIGSLICEIDINNSEI